MSSSKQKYSSNRKLLGKECLSVLIIDDEESVLNSLKEILEIEGYRIFIEKDPKHALNFLQNKQVDFILCDLQMPGLTGLEFVNNAKKALIQSPIILMSAFGNLQLAIEAMRLGAYDYIAKPFNAEELILTLKKAEERERLKKENEVLRRAVAARYNFSNIISKSSAMAEIFETIKKIADYKTTIMILGESGTGKELVSRAIHHTSSRKDKPFIAINCGAIPENLLESELFGHRRGAFTDATKDKKGLLEEAQGGTLLLDEIGDLPLSLQVKLLRVIQENEIRAVGDNRSIPIDVRVISATLRDLDADIALGRFREDLYYRLNVISIHIPPLRERKEDIPLLVDHFIKENQGKLGLPIMGISKDALAALLNYDWPGNIRELENCIERAMILCEDEEISLENLPNLITGSDAKKIFYITDDNEQLSIKAQSRTMEERLIRKALQKTGGNRTHAAKLLEISHRALLYKLKEFGIDVQSDKK